MSNQFTTDLIGLPSFQLSHWDKTTETDWVVTLTPNPASHLCPLCLKESTNHARPGYRLLRHRFIPSWGTVWVRVPV
ncbi:ISL3 family transposase, partial [Brevibacillus agri]|nr:ISL3 family transposase [Brevibacillus agri]